MQRFLLIIAALLVAAGCGMPKGDGEPAKVRPKGGTASESRAAGAGTRVIATLGDSIVAGSPLWDPDPDVRASFPRVDEDSQWQRSVTAAGNAELRNCGVWGERTDEIAARYEACTDGADAVVIQGGINDVVQGRDIDEAAHDIACMAERARADGLDIAIADVLPWNNGFPQAATPIRQLNTKLHAIAKRGGVPVLPFYKTLDDPDKPGRMPAERTEDGNHPDVVGYGELGAKAWREPVPATGSFADDCD